MFPLLKACDLDTMFAGGFDNLGDMFDVTDKWLSLFKDSKYALDVDRLLLSDKVYEPQLVMASRFMLLAIRFADSDVEFIPADIFSISSQGHPKRRVFFMGQSMHLGVIADNTNNTIVGELNTTKPEGYQPCQIKKLA